MGWNTPKLTNVACLRLEMFTNLIFGHFPNVVFTFVFGNSASHMAI